MNRSALRNVFAAAMFALFALSATTAASAATEPEKHVTMSEKTFRDFVRDPNMDWFRNHLHEARGVLIVPKVVKAGFIFGGSGGRAVLVARDESGRWGGPAYYTLATGSVGFQAGLQVSEVIILAMTQKAMDSLLSSSFRVGPDAAIAAGPVGVGTKASFQEDFISARPGWAAASRTFSFGLSGTARWAWPMPWAWPTWCWRRASPPARRGPEACCFPL